MPKQKTLEAASTGNALSQAAAQMPKKSTSTGKFKTMSKMHVCNALTTYLHSMSLIEDNEEVTNFNKAPDSLDVKIEVIQ